MREAAAVPVPGPGSEDDVLAVIDQKARSDAPAPEAPAQPAPGRGAWLGAAAPPLAAGARRAGVRGLLFPGGDLADFLAAEVALA